MARRIYNPQLRTGDIPLDATQAHHARVVLRLADGASVEVFDEAGNVAAGMLSIKGGQEVFVRVDRVDPAPAGEGFSWSVAAAVPKGERADWMVEKLSELGAAAFIPLAAARSVVLPEGRGKRDRWSRIAAESAKQSRRRGVMRIEELTPLSALLKHLTVPSNGVRPCGPHVPDQAGGWYLSTSANAVPARRAIEAGLGSPFVLLIGPEGGWTEHEQSAMAEAALTPVGLTTTILRVETAAIAAAALVATLGHP